MGGPWVPVGTQWSQWSGGVKGAPCGYDEAKHHSVQKDQEEPLVL